MTAPHYTDDAGAVTLYHGDLRDVLPTLPDASVDSVVTDPPYELGFMGKRWDASGIAYDVDAWREVLRVLKPGGHLLAFGGTRTWHRMVVAIEDAGFEIRDQILAWLYGSGFPKSLDVSKAIDKAAGAEREVVGTRKTCKGDSGPQQYAALGVFLQSSTTPITAPATPEAERWQGWGTAMKPAHEPICVARKPFPGTVAANVLEHGTGALNIDGTRIGTGGQLKWSQPRDMGYHGGTDSEAAATANTLGRWPANVVLDETAAAMLDEQSGEAAPKPQRVGRMGGEKGGLGMGRGGDAVGTWPADAGGGASRFFYIAKAASHERPRVDGIAHPTVKPVELMRWLVRLVTPPGGTVLDPFAGSGTTAEACIVEGFRCVLVEKDAAHLPLIIQRLDKPIQPTLLGGA